MERRENVQDEANDKVLAGAQKSWPLFLSSSFSSANLSAEEYATQGVKLSDCKHYIAQIDTMI